jgi:hypothetical protein
VCSTFKEVRTHDPLRIPLPPNWSSPSRSTKYHQHFDNTRLDFIEPEVVFRLKSYSRKLSTETTCPRSVYLWDDSKPRRGIPQWSAMHLAKTVQTVIACKEAIWVAYNKLFHDTLSPVHPGLTGHGKNSLKEAPPESLREEFEQEWSSWERWVPQRTRPVSDACVLTKNVSLETCWIAWGCANISLRSAYGMKDWMDHRIGRCSWKILTYPRRSGHRLPMLQHFVDRCAISFVGSH